MTQLFSEYLKENDIKANKLMQDLIRAGHNISSAGVRKWFTGENEPKNAELRKILQKLLGYDFYCDIDTIKTINWIKDGGISLDELHKNLNNNGVVIGLGGVHSWAYAGTTPMRATRRKIEELYGLEIGQLAEKK